MLLVIAPMPRLDRVQFVERLERHGSGPHEVQAAHFEVGGDGLVAMRAAKALGLDAKLLSCRGVGGVGDLLEACCTDEGFEVAWTKTSAPTPMRSVFCGCDATGATARRVWQENPPRIGDGELRRYVAAFDAELARVGDDAVHGVLIVESCEEDGALALAVDELARRSRAYGRPWYLVTRRPESELLQQEPTIVFEERRAPSWSPNGRRAARRDTEATSTRSTSPVALVRDRKESWRLQLAPSCFELEVEQPPERGGEAPLEAAAVAWLLREAEGWPKRTAACWAVAAAVAQTLKQLGGRLSMAEVDGFFARVRAREVG